MANQHSEMADSIKKKLGEISEAPTPHNTPASVTGSYLKNQPPIIPNTISEENEELKKKLLANPALMSMIEGKLNTLVGKDSGYVEKLPKEVKHRVYGLKALQQNQFKLEAEFQAELLELEKKFHVKYAPLYSQRCKIICGSTEPTAEQIAEGETLMDEEADEEDKEDEASNEQPAKGIPGFWLTALENVAPVAEIISERDFEVLSHLIDIRTEYLDTPGFRLIFEFEENEFMENRILVKTYFYQKELGYTGDFIYDHAEGCNVQWKNNDNNVTMTVERRKQRNKHTKQVRTIEKLSPADSFFNFFDPPKPPKRDENKETETPDVEGTEDQDDEDEEDVEDELEQRLELDYQIGELIKDKLIPRAIDWFTGEAMNYEFGEEDLDDEDLEFDEDDEDEEDEDEDEDDGSEDEDEQAGESAVKTQPPECKQS